MEIKRNGFMYFALTVYGIAILYAIVCTLSKLGVGQEYPYYLKGIFLILLLCMGILLIVFGVIWARLEITRRAEEHPHAAFWAENVLAVAVLCVSAAIRVHYVQTMPMAPQSDYKTYYEIAQMLNEGTLLKDGPGYCDYVAMFPHVLGYPLVLAAVFRMFGTSVAAAQYFNVALSVGTVFFVWRIVRRLSGRIGGFAGLCAAAFWPSQILYGNFVAGEYAFTFLLMGCVWLFVASLQDFGGTAAHPWLCVLELAGLGVLLALAGVIRPLAVIFLIALLIYMIPGKMKLPARLRNDIPIGLRLISRGWKRCLLVLCPYLLFSAFFSLNVGYTVNRSLASSSVSYGYNLLVGLNTQSSGGWNQKDSDYLYKAFDSTQSAAKAHQACRDLAFKRLFGSPKANFNLMVHKFEVLWGNDDYGASWNILFMDQQGNLTPQRKTFLYRMMDISDLYYLIMLVLSGVLGLYLWKKKPNASYSLVLLFLGTMALHLLVENQNRYHYHILPVFAVFAGMAVAYINQSCFERAAAAKARGLKEAREQAERKEHLRSLAEEEKRLMELRSQALHSRFDIEKALREGHVGITVSAALAKPEPPEPPDGKSENKQ